VIIVKIQGGLGNQLFQYAAARRLALQHSTTLKVDLGTYRNDSLRDFELSKFHTEMSAASTEEVRALKAEGSWQRFRSRLTPYSRRRFYKEPHFHYDARFPELGPQVYLQGYFQSAAYFAPVAENIRAEFRFRNEVIAPVQEHVDDLLQGNSVALHIRRGDYKNPETEKVHGILRPEYYLQATRLISDRLPDARFFLFTDDAAWVKQHFDLPGAQLVSNIYTQNHYQDLYLMSRCRHQVIANSSFSWWGAWLNPNPGKLVIAPKAWFNEGPADTQNLIPDTWMRL
jgi:hypothetical protein